MVGYLLTTPANSHAQAEGCHACVGAASGLAEVNSNDGALLDAVASGLLGTDVNLGVGWGELASANINLLDFLGVLQADLGVGSPSDVLTTGVDLLDIIAAAISVAQTNGNTAAVDALQQLRLSINALSPLPPMVLGNLLDVTTNDGSITDSSINLLELVQGSISLFNHANIASTPTPIEVGVDGLGLVSDDYITNAQLYIQVIEPPIIACGPEGTTTFYTAAIRTKLHITLANIDISDEILGLIDASDLASLQANLVELDLYADIAQGNGIITMIDAFNSMLKVEAEPGLVNLYLGEIADEEPFFDGSSDPETVLGYGTIGHLTIELFGSILGTAIEVDINARAIADGHDPTPEILTFPGSDPYPYRESTNGSTTAISNLLGSLFENIEVDLDITTDLSLLDGILDILNPLLNSITAALTGTTGVLADVLINPVLTPVLVDAVDPLLGALGVGIGGMEVTASAPNCFILLEGCVYEDPNHNATKDPAEDGTGLTLYAKLVNQATPGQVDSVVTVDPATGEYSFGLTGMGTYDIIIDDNDDGTDITSHKPSGWVGTENPDQQISGIAITGEGAISDQNFGLFHGSKTTGQIFNDDGRDGGTAHNGLQETAEVDLNKILVRALTSSATEIDRTRTDAEGRFTLWIGQTYHDQQVRIREEHANQYISVAGDPGTSGGTYSRTNDHITFTVSSGTEYTGLRFADVPTNSFTPLGRQYANPGSVIFYQHQYQAYTSGTVTFSLQEKANPDQEAWHYQLYSDTNCNGQIDADTENPVSSNLRLNRNEKACFVVRVQVPAGIEAKARQVLNITGTFTLASTGISYPLTVHDETIVGEPSGAGLLLEKTVNKPAAVPGDSLTYTVTYRNNSSKPLQMLSIDDSTPSYTVFSAADCGALPQALTSCSITKPASGGQGAVIWEFEGPLQPGAEGSVTYQVIIKN